MALFTTTLGALLPLFCLILLGYGLKRFNVLNASHVTLMNGLVVNVTLPALVLLKLATAPRIERATALPPLLLMLAEAVVIALAFGLARLCRFSRPTTGALVLVAAFGNTGFLGYPIALALLPHQFTAAVLLDQIGMTLPLYLIAPLLGVVYGVASSGDRLTHSDTRAAFSRVLRSPIFLGLAIGLLARLAPHPTVLAANPTLEALGNVAGQTLGYLGQATTPLILLSLGIALRPRSVGSARIPVGVAVALKLGVAPLAMLFLGRACGLHGDLATIGVVQGAMPSAVMASVLSSTNDLDGDTAVAVVFVTTLLSAVTIPLWAILVR